MAVFMVSMMVCTAYHGISVTVVPFHTITTNVQLPPYRYQRYRRSLDISAMLIACDFTRVEGLGTTRFTQQYCTQQKIPRLDSSGMYSLTHHSLTFEIWSPV